MSHSPSPDAREALEGKVRSRPLPGHVAIIMDGNGRWAEARGQERICGHREGSESVREITRAARRVGLQALTLYAFSPQNWQRPAQEVAALMELLREYLLKERGEIMENGIRLHAIGDLDRLPKRVREPLEALREESAGHSGMTLTLALSYGGREEILRAAKLLAQQVAEGVLSPDQLSEESLERSLWTEGLPPLDLLIRTSGEVRLSNFLLWQAAYAELIFEEVMWPDFRTEAFLRCLDQYQGRQRRYGLTGAQAQLVRARSA